MVRVIRVSQVRQFVSESTRLERPIGRYMYRKALLTAKYSKQRLNRSPRRIDTGLLRASILPVKHPTIRGGWRIGTDVPYAPYVLYGTRYMQANPFLVDGLNRAFA
jgi:hypothetical protein